MKNNTKEKKKPPSRSETTCILSDDQQVAMPQFQTYTIHRLYIKDEHSPLVLDRNWMRGRSGELKANASPVNSPSFIHTDWLANGCLESLRETGHKEVYNASVKTLWWLWFLAGCHSCKMPSYLQTLTNRSQCDSDMMWNWNRVTLYTDLQYVALSEVQLVICNCSKIKLSSGFHWERLKRQKGLEDCGGEVLRSEEGWFRNIISLPVRWKSELCEEGNLCF